MSTQTALTIGNFDGVHRGHAALIERARLHLAQAHRPGAPAPRIVAIALFPSPRTILSPGSAPALLTDWPERERLLRAAGADEVVRLTPTRELLAQDPEAFLTDLIRAHNPCLVVEGADFHFGKGRAGDVHLLQRLGDRLGFTADILPPVEVPLTNQIIVTASSTMVRTMLELGRVGDAARILGRPYELIGAVEQGDQRGRTIGFPTANLSTAQALPRAGVYAALAIVPGGARHPAAVHIGPRATFADQRTVVEAHILDWPGPAPGAPEYGWALRLSLLAFVRDAQAFDGVESLRRQIARDVARVRRIAGAAPSVAAGAIPDEDRPAVALA